MDSKGKAVEALRIFCQEFGVTDKLTFDGSQEHNNKRTEFMHQIRRNDIDYHVIEPERHNENPAEGVIQEVRRKWYRTMIRKRVLKKFWHEAAGLPAVAADESIAAGESIAENQWDSVNVVVKEEQQPAAIVDLSIADVSIAENQLDSVNPVIKEELKPAAIAEESIGGNQWDFTNAAERQEKERNNPLGATAALS